jgi:pimeloyl-ACP methyl ester carboxylesterase
MQIIERGHGFPLVFIPGLQGRWEYMHAAVDALAEVCHVVTFSLCDEPTACAPFDAAEGLDSYADQVVAALDDRGIARAAICGVSFGGLIAIRMAARHPDRTAALIVASAPGPRWHLKRRHEFYARMPWLLGPLFLAEMPLRAGGELAAALPDRSTRYRFLFDQFRTVVSAPLSLNRMAARARMIAACDRAEDCRRVAAPTLIVHGEPRLDHVVDVNGTSQYATLIRGARTSVLEGTGHLGSITRPHEFASIAGSFLASLAPEDQNSAA